MRRVPEKLLVSTLIGFSALAPGMQANPAYAQTQESEQRSAPETRPLDLDTTGLADGDELFAQYVDRAFGLVRGRQRLLMAQRDGRLSDKERKVYDVLKTEIEKVASGARSSTNITVPFKDVYGKTQITAEDVGVSVLTHDSLQAYLEKDLSVENVIQALLLDLPYDFYWYDKTDGGSFGIPRRSITSGVYSYGNSTGYTFSLKVNRDYRGANEYTADTTKTRATSTAVSRAKAIIRDAASMSDWGKLDHYRKQICGLTSYNDEAAKQTNPAYGDPWQLVYVFDGNPATEVVCEGYAKAFKYLCDNTDFESDEIEAYIMTGTLEAPTGGGDHMWNVVHMDDGRNYLVDLTGCDEGGVGAPDQLFFKGATANAVARDYTVACRGGNPRYAYDAGSLAAYTDEERTLSSTSYDPRSHSVKVVAGAHMTRAAGSGAAEQDDLTGAMAKVVYTADTGYYFPTTYSVAGRNGVTVTRDGATQVSVSGTPTAHTTITLPAATAKGREATPAATFTATGPDGGTLTGVSAGMQYRVGTSGAWTTITGSSVRVSGLTNGSSIQLRRPAGDVTLASDVQTIDVTKAQAPIGPAAHDCASVANDDGEITGVTSQIEYRASGASEWVTATGSAVTGLRPGTYEVRRRATDTVLASEPRTLTIRRFISRTVTFRVANGAWDKGGTEDKTVTLTGHEGDTLTLGADQIPAAGARPRENHKAGAWDQVPRAGTAIEADTTYTYTYAPRERIAATVTFRVVGGTWDDQTTQDKTVRLTGYEGDTLSLGDGDIPAVGSSPDLTHKAGDWDETPLAGTVFANGTTQTYTYTYAPKERIGATVTFRVVNGTWKDGSTEMTVPLTGYEGETLTLKGDDIPAVGDRPDDGYGQGVWDVVPTDGATVSQDRTYTYTYLSEDSRTATVTFRVVDGSWDDMSAGDVVVTVVGSRDEAPALTLAQIPAVGTRPRDGFKAGGWDTAPLAGATVTDGATYTYAYAPRERIGATVTFSVVGGSWNDGTTRDQTVPLTGFEGDTLSLRDDQIPKVGDRPDGAHKAGGWDETPLAGTALANGTTQTYTYTYAPRERIAATVTFRVVGGSWDDGGTRDLTRTVEGFEGDTLSLGDGDIPAVGSSPDRAHKAGGWDSVPLVGAEVADGATYTYAYAPRAAIGRTVTFRVVGGAWDDGSTQDKTVRLSGYEGDTLELGAGQIPTAGSHPQSGYRAGGWDTTPTAGPVTSDRSYTYSYAKREDGQTLAPEPTARTGLVFDGTPQQLISPVHTAAGTMQYALGANASTAPTEGWSTAIPTRTEAGDYFVWYRVVDDAGEVALAPACVRVSIAASKDPTPAQTPTSTASTVSFPTTPRHALTPFSQYWPQGAYVGPYVDPYVGSYVDPYGWATRPGTSSPTTTGTGTGTNPGTGTDTGTSPATSKGSITRAGSTTGTSPATGNGPSASTGPAERATTITRAGATTGTGTPASTGHAPVRRLAGADRYSTMSAVVSEAFPSAGFVTVASGQSFADALVSAPLAGTKGAPIIITKKNLLQRDATEQVDRLRPTGAYVVGGSGALTERAEEAVRLSGSGKTAVTRVAGRNRQTTSVAALHEVRRAGSTSDTIIVASGRDFADALSISPWAYATGSAMLLTTNDGRLTQEEVDAIRADGLVRRVVLVGGASAVSDAVRDQLGAGLTVERVGGADRYATSRKVAEFSVANGMSWSTVAIATGRDYPDALAGAALVGKGKGVLLLVDDAQDPAIAAIRENAGKVERLYVLGGEGAVSASVESAARAAVTG